MSSYLKILLILIIIITISYIPLKKFKKLKNENTKLIIETLEIAGILFTFWFSIFSIEQANGSLQETKNQMQTLHDISTSTEQTSKSLINTNQSLDTLSNKLSKLPVQLDNFYKGLDKLNAMVKTQTDELNRKPDLTCVADTIFVKDSIIILNNVWLLNKGEISVKINKALFYVPKKDFAGCYILGGNKVNETETEEVYQVNMKPELVLIGNNFNRERLLTDIRYKLKKDIKQHRYVDVFLSYVRPSKEVSGGCTTRIFID